MTTEVAEDTGELIDLLRDLGDLCGFKQAGCALMR